MKNMFSKKSIIATAVVSTAIGLVGVFAAFAVGPTYVDLLTADSFAVLAGSGITDTNPSVVVGDVGLSPTGGTAIGIPAVEVTGTIYAMDANGPAGSVSDSSLVNGAKASLVTAYDDAAQQTPLTTVPTELGGTTKTAGIYNSSAGTFGITGTLTLDAEGDPNAVFIFKMASTLTTASGSIVNLVNGAQACNVVWQVGSSATLGTGSNFKGNLLALTSITDNGGSTILGRLLARNGAVTLNNTNLTKATCAAGLNVIKEVVNVSGGTATAPMFNVHVKLAGSDVSGSPAAGVVSPGRSYSLAGGTYTISEDAVSGYGAIFTGDCNASGSITLASRDSKTCTITNTDVPIPPAPTLAASVGGGHYYNAPLPLINVTKIPSPLDLPAGPGPVTYTYAVTNVGEVAMRGVWAKDDKCEDVKFISGDANQNSLLDMSEIWLYSCTKTVTKTETNTVTAHGQANGWDGYDTANATVVVGKEIIPPLIHVVKKPNVFVLPAGGGAVTYSYTVTNPGTAPLSDVTITDNKCTGLPGRVLGHPGDINKNNLLENTETWTFTCKTDLTETTTNIGTARGSANGLTAIDFSPATVVVAPGFPSTGFGSDGVSWIVVILGGVLVAVAAFFIGKKKGAA